MQTKRDLSRTKKAEEAIRRRRALNNKPLKTGGRLTVAEGRQIVGKNVIDEVAKASVTRCGHSTGPT